MCSILHFKLQKLNGSLAQCHPDRTNSTNFFIMYEYTVLLHKTNKNLFLILSQYPQKQFQSKFIPILPHQKDQFWIFFIPVIGKKNKNKRNPFGNYDNL